MTIYTEFTFIILHWQFPTDWDVQVFQQGKLNKRCTNDKFFWLFSSVFANVNLMLSPNKIIYLCLLSFNSYSLLADIFLKKHIFAFNYKVNIIYL